MNSKKRPVAVAAEPSVPWMVSVLEAMPRNIALLDAQGVIVAVNAAWRRFAMENGILMDAPAPGTGIGTDYLALCDAAQGPSAEGAREVAAGIRAVLARQLPIFTREYPCHSPTQQRWFLVTVLPIEHRETAALVVHAEITEQKLEQFRRRDSELRLRLSLEATGDGLWDWNLQTGETYLSPGYYRLTGYRPDEAPGSLELFQRLVHPGDWAEVMATIEAHLRGDTPTSDIKYRMITATGTIRWIHGRGRVVERDAEGKPLRMLGLISDITAFKDIERALIESEARYRAVVEDQTEVIGRVSADGTILFANEIYLRFFNKAAHEIIGQKWQPVAHPDDLPMIEAKLQELSADHPVVIIENRVYTGDGRLRWMQFVNRGIFDAAGHLLEIQVVGRDITERHALETAQQRLLDENRQLGRELIRVQEMERAALAKELHDELSQQLVAIRAFAGAIERRTDSPLDKTSLDACAIGIAASNIYAISHRLMEGLHPQALDSAGLVAAITGLLDNWGQTKPEVRIKLRTTPIGQLGPELRINLFRIVQECLTNAIQHGRARRIRIFLGERQFGPRYQLHLVVRDDGVGMALDEQRAGYGLILMRERAEILGGRLELQSRPGHGTRIAVHIDRRA